MPVTYGFSWIAPDPATNDWAYILFCWDNIFASYSAGVLGYSVPNIKRLRANIKKLRASIKSIKTLLYL